MHTASVDEPLSSMEKLQWSRRSSDILPNLPDSGLSDPSLLRCNPVQQARRRHVAVAVHRGGRRGRHAAPHRCAGPLHGRRHARRQQCRRRRCSRFSAAQSCRRRSRSRTARRRRCRRGQRRRGVSEGGRRRRCEQLAGGAAVRRGARSAGDDLRRQVRQAVVRAERLAHERAVRDCRPAGGRHPAAGRGGDCRVDAPRQPGYPGGRDVGGAQLGRAAHRRRLQLRG